MCPQVNSPEAATEWANAMHYGTGRGIALFHRAGFGSVLGLLATGAVLGPHTPGPVVDIEQLTAAAELGVVFLLFVIGLELEPRRLWAMRRALFGLGTLQVVITGLALAAIGLAVGLDERGFAVT